MRHGRQFRYAMKQAAARKKEQWMCRSLLIALLALLSSGVLHAEEPAPRPAPSAGAPASEPTYPEIVVGPESSAAPDAGPAGAGAAGSGEGVNYPSLSEQVFGAGEPSGGLNGVTRGAKSVFDIPSLGTVVNREALVEKQAGDMAQALQNEVGVLMQQTARGQVSPFLRGLTGQQVLILIDGVRMNNSVYRAGPNQYFNLIDPGLVDRIEVVRGPESVLWGSDAIGGVINVVTRSAARDRGDYTGAGFTERFASADVSSYSRASAEGWVGSTGVFGGGSYLNVNDLHRGGNLGTQPFTNYDQYSGDVKFDRMLSKDSLLTVAVQHFEQSDLPRSDRFLPFVLGPPANSPRPTWYDPQQRDLAYVRLQGLGSSSLFDAYTTTISYSRNKEGSREIRSATRTDVGEFDVDTLGCTVTMARDLDGLGKFTYGVDYYHDGIQAFRNRVNPTTGKVTADNPQFPNDSVYARTGAYLNWEAPLTERLTGIAGVRYENDTAAGVLNQVTGTPNPFERNYQGWINSIGLIYEVNPMFHVVGNVSEGYRAPNLDDLTADNPVLQDAQDVPSLNVRPERARTYEVGLKFDTERLRLQVFEYWCDLQDNILRQAVDGLGNPVPNKIGPYGTTIPGSSNFIRANFDSYINGTELAGEYLMERGWSVYGNFFYTYGQDLERNEPLSRIPPLQGVLGVRWRAPEHRQWADVYTWLVARQERYNSQNNIDSRFPVGGTPGYATLNMRVGTTLGERDLHRVSLGLENITNTAYRVLGSGVDGPGFNVILGYEWQH